MRRIETVLLGAEWVLGGISGEIQHGRRSDPVSVPLLPSFADAQAFRWVKLAPGAEFGVYQPYRLSQEGEQQQSGEQLGPAKTFTREI